MIQRIQTIYLILASACFFYFSTASLAWLQDAANTEVNLIVKKFPIMYWTSIGLGVLSLVAIFLYKNMRNQINLVWTTAFLSLILIGMIFYQLVDHAQGVESYKIFPTTFLPSAAFVLLLLAGRSINNDLRIVSSSDRLR